DRRPSIRHAVKIFGEAMSQFAKRGCLLLLMVWSAVGHATGLPSDAGAEPIVDRNVFIAVRDGTRLATDLYLPARKDSRVPVILLRTPYGKDDWHDHYRSDPQSILGFFLEHGYALAIQDIRGRFHSEGSYTVAAHDAEDGYDTIDWLSKQDWSSGSVGT